MINAETCQAASSADVKVTGLLFHGGVVCAGKETTAAACAKPSATRQKRCI